MWKWSFRARLPGRKKTESWRCENKIFVQDFPQKLKVENVEAWKTALRRRAKQVFVSGGGCDRGGCDSGGGDSGGW